jgi:hypothetical protein
MTPGKTGGMRNVVVVKAPKAAILHLSCFAPSGLLVNLHLQTPSAAADGVIIVMLLRSKIFLLTDHCL